MVCAAWSDRAARAQRTGDGHLAKWDNNLVGWPSVVPRRSGPHPGVRHRVTKFMATCRAGHVQRFRDRRPGVSSKYADRASSAFLLAYRALLTRSLMAANHRAARS